MQAACAASKSGMPLVVIDGSGRGANLLAYAYRLQHYQGRASRGKIRVEPFVPRNLYAL